MKPILLAYNSQWNLYGCCLSEEILIPNAWAHAKKDLCLKFKLNLALSEQYMRRMPEIKLTYFNIEGKAELIRLLLHAGNFEFEDFRVGSLIKKWYKRGNNRKYYLKTSSNQVRSSRIPLPDNLPDTAPLWPGELKSATSFGQVLP